VQLPLTGNARFFRLRQPCAVTPVFDPAVFREFFRRQQIPIPADRLFRRDQGVEVLLAKRAADVEVKGRNGSAGSFGVMSFTGCLDVEQEINNVLVPGQPLLRGQCQRGFDR
jgi:hypothetical protein